MEISGAEVSALLVYRCRSRGSDGSWTSRPVCHDVPRVLVRMTSGSVTVGLVRQRRQRGSSDGSDPRRGEHPAHAAQRQQAQLPVATPGDWQDGAAVD